MNKRKIVFPFIFGLLIGRKGVNIFIHLGYIVIILVLAAKVFKLF